MYRLVSRGGTIAEGPDLQSLLTAQSAAILSSLELTEWAVYHDNADRDVFWTIYGSNSRFQEVLLELHEIGLNDNQHWFPPT